MKFEHGPDNRDVSTDKPETIESIVSQALELPQFQVAVKQTKDRLEAIRRVRILLGEHFPGIAALPNPKPPEEDENAIRLKNPLGGVALNEFNIAKQIVDLLWDGA